MEKKYNHEVGDLRNIFWTFNGKVPVYANGRASGETHLYGDLHQLLFGRHF